MKTQRVVVLGLALVAACASAFLARGLIGGGTPKVVAKPAPPPIAMSEVLVAANDLQPGQPLLPESVRWQKWPTASVAPGFITASSGITAGDVVKDAVVHAPMVSGEPVTATKIVRGKSGGFLAATLEPGMRAVSITITTDSGAGGFILPNDRVDLILTQKGPETPPKVRARTILRDILVLAIDQTATQDKGAKVVLGKTATLELTPSEALTVARSGEEGQLSLSLRALGDFSPAVASLTEPAQDQDDGAVSDSDAASVAIIRYGVARSDAAGAANAQRGQ